MTGLWAFRQLFTKITKDEEITPEEVSLAHVIESGDFKIDLTRRTASLAEQQLQLTSEEFDVLVFLAGHPQKLVTPNTVLSTNWSSNGSRQAEFLRVLLSLRAKLEATQPGQRYLRTEPWVLYRFDSSSAA
ncbi:MAG TPA: winged helix-turn-helix domain-containing protein [Terriglobales bacterium]|nr:winged helix-turn-helix domain-containing protein [Terriglobales bacterium]